MDKRVLDLVSNKLITRKNEVEIELERLINSHYSLSVEQLTERIQKTTSDLSNILHTIQMWESIVSQVMPQQENNPNEGDNK